MENAGHPVSRNDLMVRLWESESFIDDNTLTVNVSRLRRKLESVGLEGLLVTKKGVGYVLE
jgi:DNA-binding response OmpR family regulator